MPPKAKAKVEQKTDDDKPMKSIDDAANDVLKGTWGSYEGLRERLDDAGHDASAVLTKVNERLVRGAPSAFQPTALDIAESVRRGEWGPEKGLKQRLAAAGFGPSSGYSVLKH
jgi:hypothetical protein